MHPHDSCPCRTSTDQFVRVVLLVLLSDQFAFVVSMLSMRSENLHSKIPIQALKVFSNTSSASATPSPVKYCTASMSTLRKKAAASISGVFVTLNTTIMIKEKGTNISRLPRKLSRKFPQCVKGA